MSRVWSRTKNEIGWANEVGHSAIVQLLLDHGASMNIREAVSWNQNERVKEMVKRNPDLARFMDHSTPLHEAAANGNREGAQ